MTRIQFKHAVLFNPQTGSKITKPVQFSRGIHDVSDEILAHPYFEKLHAAGSVVEASSAPVPEPESLQERNKRLHARMMKARVGVAETAPSLPAGAELPPEVQEAAAAVQADAESEEGHNDEAAEEKHSEEPKKGKKHHRR